MKNDKKSQKPKKSNGVNSSMSINISKGKSVAKYVIVGILLVAMIGSMFVGLISAIQ